MNVCKDGRDRGNGICGESPVWAESVEKSHVALPEVGVGYAAHDFLITCHAQATVVGVILATIVALQPRITIGY